MFREPSPDSPLFLPLSLLRLKSPSPFSSLQVHIPSNMLFFSAASFRRPNTRLYLVRTPLMWLVPWCFPCHFLCPSTETKRFSDFLASAVHWCLCRSVLDNSQLFSWEVATNSELSMCKRFKWFLQMCMHHLFFFITFFCLRPQLPGSAWSFKSSQILVILTNFNIISNIFHLHKSPAGPQESGWISP